MGDTAINVPVDVRTHERNQLQEWLPAIADDLRDGGVGEGADEVERIFEEHVDGIDKEYVSMPAEDWRMTIRYLNRARTLGKTGNELRAHWLQQKLINRIEERMEELQ